MLHASSAPATSRTPSSPSGLCPRSSDVTLRLSMSASFSCAAPACVIMFPRRLIFVMVVLAWTSLATAAAAASSRKLYDTSSSCTAVSLSSAWHRANSCM